jgi:hypothetical protein
MAMNTAVASSVCVGCMCPPCRPGICFGLAHIYTLSLVYINLYPTVNQPCTLYCTQQHWYSLTAHTVDFCHCSLSQPVLRFARNLHSFTVPFTPCHHHLFLKLARLLPPELAWHQHDPLHGHQSCFCDPVVQLHLCNFHLHFHLILHLLMYISPLC